MKKLLIPLCCVSGIAAHAQMADSARRITDTTVRHMPGHCSISQDKYLSILTVYGYNTYSIAELGIAVNKYGVVGYHPGAWAYFISGEVRIDRRLIAGPKIGCWAGGRVGGLAMGLNFIDYIDAQNTAIRFRPEIGFGFGIFKAVYGYNVAVTNKEFKGIGDHNFSVVLLWGVKKLGETRIK